MAKLANLSLLALAAMIVLIGTGSAWAVLTDGLIALWKFDEGSGETAFDSAGNNDGILMNGPSWTSGIVGAALSFDGQNNYVEIPNEENFELDSGAYTVCFWIKTTSTDEDPVIAKHIYGSWNGWSFGINGRGHDLHLYYATTSGEQNLYSDKVIADNAWHFISGVIDVTNAEMFLYLDYLRLYKTR